MANLSLGPRAVSDGLSARLCLLIGDRIWIGSHREGSRRGERGGLDLGKLAWRLGLTLGELADLRLCIPPSA